MTDLYRGFEIKPTPLGGFYWTDECGLDHAPVGESAAAAGYATPEQAMDAIDAHRRALRDRGL